MRPARHPSTTRTHDDPGSLPRNGRRQDLIGGARVVTPSPARRRQQLSLRLVLSVGTYLRGRPLGELYPAPADVVLSDVDVVVPDILFVSNERAAILQDRVLGAPDLVVEILSPHTRGVDEVTKRLLYDRAGVREYWIVDPEPGRIAIHRRADGGSFPRIAELTREAHDRLCTPLLPGFFLDLDELFG